MSVIPAVIPHSLDHLKETLSLLSFASEIQIDLVDGVFASPVSWPYEPAGTIADAVDALEPFQIEVDLMVSDPLLAARTWQTLGVNRFILHLESIQDTSSMVAFKNETGAVLGACVGNDMPLTELTNVLSDVDFVQVMGIDEIGAQGRPFDERVLGRIRELRSTFPHLLISVDGAVREDTLPRLKEAGANRFVVGSAILNADNPQKMYEDLSSLAA